MSSGTTLPISCFVAARQLSVVDVFQLILQSLARRDILLVWPFSAPQWHHFCYFLSCEPVLISLFPALEEFHMTTAEEIAFFCMHRKICAWSPDGQTISLPINAKQCFCLSTTHNMPLCLI
jgi:hypothetical protein